MSWFLKKGRVPATGKRVLLCIGHSRKTNGKRDGGAVSVGGVQEWSYNLDLASRIQPVLESRGHTVEVVSDYGEANYAQAAQFASGRAVAFKADVCLELHFNAAGEAAKGHEWLVVRGDDRALALAASINRQFCTILPELRQRGVKQIGPKDRGYGFLRAMPCPIVICEPFFGSNEADWQVAVDRKRMIAFAIAEGVDQFLA